MNYVFHTISTEFRDSRLSTYAYNEIAGIRKSVPIQTETTLAIIIYIVHFYVPNLRTIKSRRSSRSYFVRFYS